MFSAEGTSSAKALGQALLCGREGRPVSRGRVSQRVEKEQKLRLDVTAGDTGSHRRVWEDRVRSLRGQDCLAVE